MPAQSTVAVLSVALAMTPCAVAQTTRYVAPCGDDSWTGLSAECAAATGPKRTIQAAIDASASGDTVRIAPGVYYEHIDFGGRDITVQGAGIDQTIIDGQRLGSVVTFTHAETAAAILRDVTLQRSGEYLGGVNIHGASPTLLNCSLDHDESLGYGGGITAIFCSSRIINCRITNCQAQDSGAMRMYDSSITMVNCYISRNIGLPGAIQLFESSSLSLVSCTIANNSVFSAVSVSSSSVSATNCIFWHNHAGSNPELVNAGSGSISVRFSDVQNGFPGPGNIDADPLLINDFHLPSASPCVDRADNSVFATYGDLLGQPRAVTINSTAGSSLGPRIDMGCFELQPCAANCDQSTTPPILNVNDFMCFMTRFAQGCP